MRPKPRQTGEADQQWRTRRTGLHTSLTGVMSRRRQAPEVKFLHPRPLFGPNALDVGVEEGTGVPAMETEVAPPLGFESQSVHQTFLGMMTATFGLGRSWLAQKGGHESGSRPHLSTKHKVERHGTV